MTPRPPTPQAISSLLREAGFERSNHGDKGVMWNEHSTGYRAYSGGGYEDVPPFVTVIHYDAGQSCCEDCHARHKDQTAPEMLSRYAEAISAAGWERRPQTRRRPPPDRYLRKGGMSDDRA